MSQSVYVYRWSYWDSAASADRTSTMYATLELIKCGLGKPVLGTAKKIARDDLRDGFYLPAEDRPTA